MFKYVLQTLKKRRTRTLLTMLAIAICIQMYSVISSIITYTEKDLLAEADKYTNQMFIKTRSIMSSSGETFPPIDSAIGVEEITDITQLIGQNIDANNSTPILYNMIANATYPNGAPQAMAVGIQPGKEQTYIGNAEIAQGTNKLEKASKQVILGYSAAKFYKVNKIGEQIDILGTKFEVVGILRKTTRVEDPVVLIDIDECQQVFSLPNTYSALLVTPRNAADVQNIKNSVDNQYERLVAIGYSDIYDNMTVSLNGTHLFMGVIKITVLLVSVVIILIVMTILERTHELGILRAIGASKKNIIRNIVFEATILSIIGGIVGTVLGFVMMRYVMQGEGFFTISIAIESIGIAVVLGILSSLVPAIRTNKIKPQEALRYE